VFYELIEAQDEIAANLGFDNDEFWVNSKPMALYGQDAFDELKAENEQLKAELITRTALLFYQHAYNIGYGWFGTKGSYSARLWGDWLTAKAGWEKKAVDDDLWYRPVELKGSA